MRAEVPPLLEVMPEVLPHRRLIRVLMLPHEECLGLLLHVEPEQDEAGPVEFRQRMAIVPLGAEPKMPLDLSAAPGGLHVACGQPSLVQPRVVPPAGVTEAGAQHWRHWPVRVFL